MRRRTPARVAALALLFAASLAAPPSRAEEGAHYSRAYRAGRLAHLAGNHRNAVLLLLEAIEKNAVEGEPWVRLYGRNRAPYLPYYYLGASLFELGEYAAALEAFDESERQGAVLAAEEAPRLRAYRERLRAEVVPELRAETVAELAAVRRLLDDVELAVAAAPLEQAETAERARVEIAVAESELAREEARDDLQALHATRETLARLDVALASVLELAERARRDVARRDRDERLAAVLATRPAGCDRPRLDALAELLARDLPLETTLEAEAELELANAALLCDELAAARRALDRAANRLAAPDARAERVPALRARAANLAEGIDRRELETAWRAWLDRAHEAPCAAEAMDPLERSAEALLVRWPRASEQAAIAPRLVLASLSLACGDLDAAESRLAAATAAREADETARAELAGAIDTARTERSLQRARDEAARRLEEALARLAGPLCLPAARTEGATLRDALAAGALVEGRVLARLDLALARAAMACGDLDAAALHLVPLSLHPEVGAGEVANLAREIVARREAATRAAQERDAAGRFDAALALLADGTCSAEGISLLEALDREGWHGSAGGPPERVLLALVRARLACGELAAATALLARPELGRPDVATERESLRAEAEALRLAAARAARRAELETALAARLREVAGEGCRAEATRALRATLEANADDLAALGVPLAGPFVELARAELACGELETALASLGAARARGDDDRAAALAARIESERARRRERERWERLLERYVDAVTAADLDQCERSAIDTLQEIAALPADDPLARWLVDVSGLARPAQLDLARALASCGAVEAARSALERATAGGVDAAARQDVERRLLDREARRLYRGRYALLVGASDYARQRGGWWNLAGVREDLEALGRALDDAGFDAVRVVEPPATASRVRAAVESFLAEFGGATAGGEENLLLFYFAGHGETLTGRLARDDGSYEFKSGYFVPEDAPRPDGSEATRDRFLELAIGMDEVDRWARSIRAKHVLFLFDTCFSGTVFRAVARGRGLLLVGGKDDGRSLLPPLVLARATKPVRLFATAGAEDQVVPDQSVFRRLLVEALEGVRADADFTRDGFLMGRELCLFLEDQVAVETESRQTPQCGTMPPPYNEGDVIFEIRGSDRAVEASRREELRQEAAVWRGAREEPKGLDRYLERYPGGRFAGIARFLARRTGADAAPPAVR